MLLVLSMLFASPVFAADNTLIDIRELAVRCSVLPVHVDAQGHETDLTPYSVCAELQVHGQNGVAILNGERFALMLSDSADSDGGDLNKLDIISAKGVKLAEYDNILAYGNLLSALVGGHTELFRKEFR